jgi:hypothetical protein
METKVLCLKPIATNEADKFPKVSMLTNAPYEMPFLWRHLVSVPKLVNVLPTCVEPAMLHLAYRFLV